MFDAALAGHHSDTMTGHWQALLELPPLLTGAVAVAVAAGFCILLLPLAMLWSSEPGRIRDWWRSRRGAVVESGVTSSCPLLLVTLELVNVVVGHLVCWLILYMVLLQFGVVVLRYVFAYGSLPMQESIWYLNGILFMLGAGYTLLHDGHVRVDVWYAKAGPRWRAAVNLGGALLLLLPLCGYTLWSSWDYVLQAWVVREGSTEASGLAYLYLLKTVIPVFAVLLALQGLVLALRSLLALLPGVDDTPATGRRAN